MSRLLRGVVAAVILAALALLVVSHAAAAADTQAPGVFIVSPADGALIGANALGSGGVASVLIEGSITDDVSLNASNTSVRVVSLGEGALGWSVVIPFAYIEPDLFALNSYASIPDGNFLLVVDAGDDAGNAVHSEVRFSVDTRAPSIEITAPLFSTEAEAQIIVDARDDGSGIIVPLSLSYRSACSSSWHAIEMEVTVLPGRVVGRATLSLCEGTGNQFSVSVTDVNGNIAQVLQRKITYDVSPPGFTGFRPGPFETLQGPSATLEVWVSDNAVGVNSSSVEAQISSDGGLRWSDWRKATVLSNGTYVRAVLVVDLSAGGTAAVRWRATDAAGNGPAESRAQYFYMNGEPFVVSFEPAEGSVLWENSTVRIDAKFADPDADTVRATVSSDIDGNLGLADGRRVRLSTGIHNLTLEGDDGHGHVVHYVYQVEVISRLPPDLRPLFFTAVIAGTMLWAAYATWTRERDREEKAAKA